MNTLETQEPKFCPFCSKPWAPGPYEHKCYSCGEEFVLLDILDALKTDTLLGELETYGKIPEDRAQTFDKGQWLEENNVALTGLLDLLQHAQNHDAFMSKVEQAQLDCVLQDLNRLY